MQGNDGIMGDKQVRRSMFEGSLPIMVTLAPDELATTEQPQPYFFMALRNQYLTLSSESIEKHFQDYVAITQSQVGTTELWFSTVDGVPLKWHYPLGVLFDMHADARHLPWHLIAHRHSFPSDQLLRCASTDTVKAHYTNVLKEANYLKHGDGSKVANLSLQDSTNLWEGLLTNNYDMFWSANTKLSCETASSMKSVPLRLCMPNVSPLQTIVHPIDARTDASRSLEDVICTMSESFSKAKEKYIVYIQGIQPSLNTPIVWLSQYCSHADNFLWVKGSKEKQVSELRDAEAPPALAVDGGASAAPSRRHTRSVRRTNRADSHDFSNGNVHSKPSSRARSRAGTQNLSELAGTTAPRRSSSRNSYVVADIGAATSGGGGGGGTLRRKHGPPKRAPPSATTSPATAAMQAPPPNVEENLAREPALSGADDAPVTTKDRGLTTTSELALDPLPERPAPIPESDSEEEAAAAAAAAAATTTTNTDPAVPPLYDEKKEEEKKEANDEKENDSFRNSMDNLIGSLEALADDVSERLSHIDMNTSEEAKRAEAAKREEEQREKEREEEERKRREKEEEEQRKRREEEAERAKKEEEQRKAKEALEEEKRKFEAAKAAAAAEEEKKKKESGTENSPSPTRDAKSEATLRATAKMNKIRDAALSTLANVTEEIKDIEESVNGAAEVTEIIPFAKKLREATRTLDSVIDKLGETQDHSVTPPDDSVTEKLRAVSLGSLGALKERVDQLETELMASADLKEVLGLGKVCMSLHKTLLADVE